MKAYALAGCDPEPISKPATDDTLEYQVAICAALRGAGPDEVRADLAEARLTQVLEVAWKALELAEASGGDRRSRDLIVAERVRQELMALLMADPAGNA